MNVMAKIVEKSFDLHRTLLSKSMKIILFKAWKIILKISYQDRFPAVDIAMTIISIVHFLDYFFRLFDLFFQIVCRLVAILLHYLFLTVFTLMLAQGIQLYHKLHRAFSPEISFTMYLVLGWGKPLFSHFYIKITKEIEIQTENRFWNQKFLGGWLKLWT